MTEVTYTKAAIRSLRAMPANRRYQVREKIAQLAADPSSQSGNVVTLQGRDGFRLRLADWRVIFERDGNELRILDILSRGRAYR